MTHDRGHVCPALLMSYRKSLSMSVPLAGDSACTSAVQTACVLTSALLVQPQHLPSGPEAW